MTSQVSNQGRFPNPPRIHHDGSRRKQRQKSKTLLTNYCWFWNHAHKRCTHITRRVSNHGRFRNPRRPKKETLRKRKAQLYVRAIVDFGIMPISGARTLQARSAIKIGFRIRDGPRRNHREKEKRNSTYCLLLILESCPQAVHTHDKAGQQSR